MATEADESELELDDDDDYDDDEDDEEGNGMEVGVPQEEPLTEEEVQEAINFQVTVFEAKLVLVTQAMRALLKKGSVSLETFLGEDKLHKKLADSLAEYANAVVGGLLGE